jgi:hypothetical protein
MKEKSWQFQPFDVPEQLCGSNNQRDLDTILFFCLPQFAPLKLFSKSDVRTTLGKN